jgi:two-component system aerobic respiration control sensor histidine kinase ArcB
MMMRSLRPSLAAPDRVPEDDRDRAMVAHDIRSALNGILGGLSLIDQAPLDPAARQQIARVSAAAEILTVLVERVFEAPADPPGDAPRDAPAPVDLDWLADFLHRRWSGEAAAKGLGFRLDAGDGLSGAVAIRRDDLCRILGNLIGNAIKFSRDGTIHVLMRRAEDGGLRIVVRDDGPGLGRCDPTRLFDYGYRPDTADPPGDGIGLHIAKVLTEEAGGTLTLFDRAAGGTEATLLLPACLCRETERPLPAPGDIPPPDLRGRRILVAEDNPTNQMVAREILAAMGAEVDLAGDGREALIRFEEGQFDLVLVDIEMPHVSGLEVIRRIRARSDARARTPIVALTAYSMQDHRLRIAEAGADGLISKPIVSATAFGAAIAQHIRTDAPPETAADPDEMPAIDRVAFDSLVASIGPTMMSELLERIVSDLRDARDTLGAALAAGDIAGIRTTSHILISVAGAFGAARLQARASQLNDAAHGGVLEAIEPRLRACLEEIAPALSFAQEEKRRC